MKTTKTLTTAKDILALVNFICSHTADSEYKLCDEKDIRLEYNIPDQAPKWIIPVTISGKEEIEYFIFDHEFCSLSVQRTYPHWITVSFLKLTDTPAWNSYFHHWNIEGKTVESVFNTTDKENPIILPDYWWNRSYNEHQPICPILFLTPQDIINAFPFKDIVKDVKNIELKVTSYDEPVWVLTQNNGQEFVIYPCALNLFCDELNVSHDFGGDFRNPQKDEEFLVGHFLGQSVIAPLIAFKVKNEQELSILRFSEMSLDIKTDFSGFVL